jgi:hypothetical protein
MWFACDQNLKEGTEDNCGVPFARCDKIRFVWRWRSRPTGVATFIMKEKSRMAPVSHRFGPGLIPEKLTKATVGKQSCAFSEAYVAVTTCQHIVRTSVASWDSHLTTNGEKATCSPISQYLTPVCYFISITATLLASPIIPKYRVSIKTRSILLLWTSPSGLSACPDLCKSLSNSLSRSLSRPLDSDWEN